MYIEQHEIFEKTNGGLDIILDYYPDARKAVEKRGAKFSIRNEKTPSCTLRQLKDGVYVLTDFGDDSKPKNGIHIVMEQEGLVFKDALQFIAEKFKIVSSAEQYKAPEAVVTFRDAEPNENEGEWSFKVREQFTEHEVRTILSKHVIPYKKKEDGEKEIDYERVQKVFSRYHFFPLISYSKVKDRKVTTVAATDEYPIFMWDEGKFKKIYQPLSKDYRFMYYGKMDQEYLFGLDECARAYAAIEAESEPEDQDEEGKSKKPKKLSHIIYCSGGSDAMNLAFGEHQVCWGNSETAKLTGSQFRSLSKKAEKVMQCFDLDKTGQEKSHELAMEHLDLYTIELPKALLGFRDRRNKPCKDVRDYLNHFRFWDFQKLIDTALPYRFWEPEPKFNRKGEYTGMGYAADPVQLYNFLQKNGFYQFENEGEKTGQMFIQVQHNIVEEVRSNAIKNWIHQYLKDNYFDKQLRNIFYKTPLLSDNSLSNLPLVELDMNSSAPHHQFFFFNNKIVRVDDKEIREFKPGQVNQYVWREEVIDHHFKIQTPHFKITPVDKKSWDIEILKTDNKFMNYVINTSRIHWRKELEESLEGLPEHVAEDYRQKHKFDIAGPNLDEEEKQEQIHHFVNKCYGFGYLLHRYKNSSRGWGVFAMDGKLGEEGESNGGSGKSIAMNSIAKFMKSAYLSGKNPKLTDQPHIYEGITKYTDYVLVDDLHQYIDMNFFFDVLTGKMKVNPKNTKQYTLDFHEVPKFAFTSNFPVRNLSASLERRLLYMVFSDYYHYSKDGYYREHRTPEDDFGKKILDDDYTAEEWNDFYNFMIQCCHFYLNYDKIEPPMSNVDRRNLLGSMGEEFKDWADVYFSRESGRLNKLEIKLAAYEDFKHSTRSQMKSNSFGKRLQAWCKFNHYTLNPDSIGLKNPDGRILQKGEYMGSHRTLEYIYIQEGNDPIDPPKAPGEVAENKMPESNKGSVLDDLTDDQLIKSF